jgi:hypothetical protein
MFVSVLSVPINHEHRDSIVRTGIRRNVRVEQTKRWHVSTRPHSVSYQKTSVLIFSAVGSPGFRLSLWTRSWHILMLVCAGNEQKFHTSVFGILFIVFRCLCLFHIYVSFTLVCLLFKESYSVGWWVHLARNELRRTGGRRSPAFFESPLSVLC